MDNLPVDQALLARSQMAMSLAFHIVFAWVGVAVSGLASAVFVTFVNAWMNAPRGLVFTNGQLTDIDPLGALKTPFALHEIVHGSLASYAATALAVAGVHGFALLRKPESRF